MDAEDEYEDPQYEASSSSEDELTVEQRRKQEELQAARNKESIRLMAVLDHVRSWIRVSRSVKTYVMTSNEPWDRILRTKQLHITVFSMFGLAMSITMSYYRWYRRCVPDAHGDCHPGDAIGDIGEGVVAASIANSSGYMQGVFVTLIGLQVMLAASSFVVIALLVQYYGLILTERQREWSGLEELDRIDASGAEKQRLENMFRLSYRFWDSSLRWSLLAEVLVHLFYPILVFEALGNFGATLDEVAECFVFCRLYLIVRVMYIHSDTYVFRSQILRGNNELQQMGHQVNAFTTFKIVFYRYPASMIIFLTVTVIAVFGFCMFVVERNNNPLLTDLPNCYWLVWVTVSTIGYGDVTAVSTTGRVLVILIAFLTLFIMVLFGGVVTNLLSPTREQKYIQRYLEQSEAEEFYKRAAVSVIEVAFLERKKRRQASAAGSAGLRSFETKRSPAMYNVMRKMREARHLIRQSLGAAGDSVVDEKLKDAILLADGINKTLHEQGLAILFLQERVQRAAAIVKQQATRGGQGSTTIKDKVEKDPNTKRYMYHRYVGVH